MDRLFQAHCATADTLAFTQLHVMLGDLRVELTRLVQRNVAGIRDVRALVVAADRLLYTTADLR